MAKKGEKKADAGFIQIKNKKAYRDYELIEKVEAGISLVGTEVKSLRNKAADIEGAYARLDGRECRLIGATIQPYEQAAENFNHDPKRNRKLLLHRRQIDKIRAKIEQKGFTLVPLRIYFNSRGYAKVEIALARGKRQFDKRDKITDKHQKKDVRRQIGKFR